MSASPSPRTLHPGSCPDLEQEILNCAPRLRRFLRRLGGSVDGVDDLLQEVFARALRFRGSFDPDRGTLENWLMQTAFRTFLDQRSAAAKRPGFLGDAASVPDRESDPVEIADEIGHALRPLSPIERDVLLRFHRDRQSIREIAATLTLPEGTVKSHLHRARQRIAREDRS